MIYFVYSSIHYANVNIKKYSNDKNNINEVEAIKYDEPKKKKKETLGDLPEWYDEEMKDIIKTNEKPFYKRALLLLDIFDNIFIDKLNSSLLDHTVVNSAYLFNTCLLIKIPISGCLIRRFLNLYTY
ncbi:hypothetical protein PFUGPA_00604 [Plasmodium falciparum Palo Alto/Uganda]|uniref:Uncharacterized protein n=2 Tax=Plasmodium falciparum TaxID=5833 RepID=W4J789_PLAFP|nr:hypothetical protein PFMALIP_00901 [Plasmodium falciparum MaliPS096_E11]ETW57437.1 hypothetical protein PFUGPA_00604 [Plasmodium falciparum Palo Alto/Uganda]